MERVQVMAMAVFLAAGLPVPVCQAQTSPPAAAPAQSVTEQYTAGAIMRLALVDLRTVVDPKPRDYGIALALLDAAQALAPQDVDIARRRSEAAWNAADQAELLASTRQVVELDPKDTVAQLRLITAQIGRMQTVEGRLAAYDRALGPAGASLDPSIRSRLALDAALLLKERGDMDGYLQRLKQAVQLDSTNKEAAYLAVAMYTDRVGDPMGRLELLSNLLMSDPMDPQVLLEIRNSLASGGAYKAASRFHTVAARVLAAAGGGDDTEMELASLILQWRLEGARPVLTVLLDQLEAARRQADQPAGEEQNLSISRREDMRLTLPFEEVRLGASMVVGDDTELSRSRNDLSNSVRAQIEGLRDRGRRPAGITDDQAQERISELTTQTEYWRAMIAVLEPGGMRPPTPSQTEVTVQPENAAPTPAPAPTVQEAAPAGPVLDGWRAMVAGDFAGAKTHFDGAEDQDNPWLAMGRAVSLEKTGHDQEALLAYRRVSTGAPLTVLGAIASAREADLNARTGGAESAPRTDPAAFEGFARTIPQWVDDMVDRPWNYETLRVEPVANKVGVLDRARLKIRLRNLSPIPVALGSGKPINTRLLFIPAMESGGVVQVPDSEVVDVNRRLRLMPNEELDCVVWPEVGLSGYVAEQASAFPARSSWRIVQGFEAQNGTLPTPGPGSVEARSESVLHDRLPEADLSAEELATRISAADESEIVKILIAARVRMSKGDPAGAARIADAIAQRYPQWNPSSRMLALAVLPPSSKVAALKALDEQVAKETDAKVLIVAAVARPQNADDPILVAAGAVAASAKDAALAGVVTAQQERMKDGIKTYSQLGAPELTSSPAPPVVAPAAPAAGAPTATAPTTPGKP